MIDNFFLLSNIKTCKFKRLKRVIENNKKYKDQVDSMNQTKSKIENQRVKTALKYINSKNERIEKSLLRIQQEKNFEKKSMKNLYQQKENNFMSNIKNLKLKEEIERQNNAEKYEQKMKSYLNNLNYLKKTQQKKIEEKNDKIFNVHEKNKKIIEEENKQELLDKEKKVFQKFNKEYWNKKEINLKKKKKNLKKFKRYEIVKELQNDIEKKRLEQQKNYIKKINKIAQKKELHDLKKKLDFQKILQEQILRFEKVNERLKRISSNDEKYRKQILDNEREIIIKGIERKNLSVDSKRVSNSFSNDLEISLYYMKFNRELNKIKSQSVLKLNSDKQKKIFLDLIKKENERKKKEEEEKYNR